MKCQACGYEKYPISMSATTEKTPAFIIVSQYTTEFENNEGFVNEEQASIYACPKCGTLKIDV